MTTYAALWILALVMYLAYWIIRSIDAFKQYKQGRVQAVYRADRIVQDETRRHGKAVAAANDWRNSAHQAKRAGEAVQAVRRG